MGIRNHTLILHSFIVYKHTYILYLHLCMYPVRFSSLEGNKHCKPLLIYSAKSNRCGWNNWAVFQYKKIMLKYKCWIQICKVWSTSTKTAESNLFWSVTEYSGVHFYNLVQWNIYVSIFMFIAKVFWSYMWLSFSFRYYCTSLGPGGLANMIIST